MNYEPWRCAIFDDDGACLIFTCKDKHHKYIHRFHRASYGDVSMYTCTFYDTWYTLQGINISHLGKRKFIFKMPFLGDMLVPWRVYIFWIYIHYSGVLHFSNSKVFCVPPGSLRFVWTASSGACGHVAASRAGNTDFTDVTRFEVWILDRVV